MPSSPKTPKDMLAWVLESSQMVSADAQQHLFLGSY